MDVREKLVDLLDDMQRSGTGYFGSAIENKKKLLTILFDTA